MSFGQDLERAVRAAIANLSDGEFRNLCRAGSVWVYRTDAMAQAVNEDSIVCINGSLDLASVAARQRDDPDFRVDLVMDLDLREIFEFSDKSQDGADDDDKCDGDDEPLPPYTREGAMQMLEYQLSCLTDKASDLLDEYASWDHR